MFVKIVGVVMGSKSDAQKFHELTGLELPENYNAADILNRMKEFCREERYINFIKTVGEIMAPHNYHEVISIDYILNPPALLQKAVEFLEGK